MNNIPAFTSLLPLLHSRGHWEAFEDDEAEAYYTRLCSLPPAQTIAEIGLEFGRSTSIAASAAKAMGHRYIGIDPFIQSKPENWTDLMRDKIGIPFTLYHMPSESIPPLPSLGSLLIDGDHNEPYVRSDCRLHAWSVHPGGYLFAHDYGRQSLPDVKTVFDDLIMSNPDQFQFEGLYRTLAVWRRR